MQQESYLQEDKPPFVIRYKWWIGVLALLIALLLTITFIASRSMERLDARIQQVFDGPKWSIPARVYARPLELYEGLAVNQASVTEELQRLGYKNATSSKIRPGQFSRQGTTLNLHTRGFKFADGFEAPKPLSINFNNNQISALKDDRDKSIAITRLEPQVIGRISPAQTEDRLLIRLEQLPEGLKDALLAVEDPKFFQHNGLSFRGILRAIWVNIKERRFAQGGSTLTQQLIKNLFLTRERSIKRKLTEWPMAIALERRYSKEEILQAFVNEVFFAQDKSRAIHGFGLASLYFFDKPVQELETHESALLVALLKGPTYYNPLRHQQRALERRNLVLKIMHRENLLTEDALASATSKPLGISRTATLRQQPAYLDLVKQQLTRDYSTEDLHKNGLNIFTNFDPEVQSKLELAMDTAYDQIAIEHGLNLQALEKLQTASVVTRADNGEVLAVIGGRQARFAGFNRALDANRQIGSLLKPFIYTTALEQPDKFNLASLIDDSPVFLEQENGEIWSPENYSGGSFGPVMLLDALTYSLNQASVNLGLEIGVEEFVDSLKRYDLTKEIKPLPSLLLGAIELSVIDVASLYQTLASSGFNTPLRAIREVQASDGQLLQRYQLKVEQRLDDATTHQINYALQNIMRAGTGKRAYRHIAPDVALAGKSGTSNEQRDSWFAGYDGKHSVVVWMGHDDNTPTPVTGSRGALEMWAHAMKNLDASSLRFNSPASIRYANIIPATGKRTRADCPGSVRLPFHRDHEPDSNAEDLLSASCQ